MCAKTEKTKALYLNPEQKALLQRCLFEARRMDAELLASDYNMETEEAEHQEYSRSIGIYSELLQQLRK